ncbi:MAG TPA: hypothetical protein VG964_04240 [Candidatus Saccharimonadales bacterium]|nr:hypothetical protein [Candidatus Saccharimonadales bacterium]
MLWVLIVGLISGGLFTNGAPYFVKGVTGEKHPTPLGKPSSAVRSVVWGWLNIVVAVLIWHLVSMRLHPRATFVSVAAGALLVGIILADSWPKSSQRAR